MEQGLRAGGTSSCVAHQAGGAGEGLAHPHALLLVDAEGVGLDGQVVLQPALGHYQHLQCVLCLPQPQLEGLQGVVDGAHLIHEPGARAENKALFAQFFNTGTPTMCQELHQALGDCVKPDGQGSAIRGGQAGKKCMTEPPRVMSTEGKTDRMFRKTIWLLLTKLNVDSPWPSNSTPWYLPTRSENRYSNNYLYTNVHSSTNHKSQKVEKTQMSINR